MHLHILPYPSDLVDSVDLTAGPFPFMAGLLGPDVWLYTFRFLEDDCPSPPSH